MRYLSTAETAEKWGLKPSRVLKLAQGGRIPGAEIIGHSWMIPGDAEKPADARRKTKEPAKADSFRYPIFEHRDPASFFPPLSEDELRIKQVAELFHACRFDEAERTLGDIPEKAQEKYQRLHALYVGCMVDIYTANAGRFMKRYSALRAELQGDFPHKAEMMEYMYKIDASLGTDKYYEEDFRVLPGYKYHDSYLPHLACLSSVSLAFAEHEINPKDLGAYELNCIFLEQTNAYMEQQAMHINLSTAYAFLERTEEMTYHFEKAVSLAWKYDLLFVFAPYYVAMKKLFKQVMADYPDSFGQRIEALNEEKHRRYLLFIGKLSMNSIYQLISSKDSLYLFYAVQGYTNKKVAKQLGLSESTVSKKYGEVYATLGVSCKKEMVELYLKSVNQSFLE